MQRTIYLTFSDLNDDAQTEVMSIAENNIREDDEQMAEIKAMCPDMVDEIVRDRAERELYRMEFIFNV